MDFTRAEMKLFFTILFLLSAMIVRAQNTSIFMGPGLVFSAKDFSGVRFPVSIQLGLSEQIAARRSLCITTNVGYLRKHVRLFDFNFNRNNADTLRKTYERLTTGSIGVSYLFCPLKRDRMFLDLGPLIIVQSEKFALTQNYFVNSERVMQVKSKPQFTTNIGPGALLRIGWQFDMSSFLFSSNFGYFGPDHFSISAFFSYVWLIDLDN